MYHWKDESQHVVLDELEWKDEHERLSPAQRDQAVDDLIALVAAVDGILQAQSAADADYFARIASRQFSEEEVARHQIRGARRLSLAVHHLGRAAPAFRQAADQHDDAGADAAHPGGAGADHDCIARWQTDDHPEPGAGDFTFREALGLTICFGKCDLRSNRSARSQSLPDWHGFVSVPVQTGVSNWQDANIVESRPSPFVAPIPLAKRISSSVSGKSRWKWRVQFLPAVISRDCQRESPWWPLERAYRSSKCGNW